MINTNTIKLAIRMKIINIFLIVIISYVSAYSMKASADFICGENGCEERSETFNDYLGHMLQSHSNSLLELISRQIVGQARSQLIDSLIAYTDQNPYIARTLGEATVGAIRRLAQTGPIQLPDSSSNSNGWDSDSEASSESDLDLDLNTLGNNFATPPALTSQDNNPISVGVTFSEYLLNNARRNAFMDELVMTARNRPGFRETSTLYHYTDEIGYSGINHDQSLLASPGGLHGPGHYFTDLAPNELARHYSDLLGDRTVTHFFAIDISGLNIQENVQLNFHARLRGVPSHNFMNTQIDPLDISGRVVNQGLWQP